LDLILQEIKTDLLVLGAGLAGGIAALNAADQGVDVVIVSSGESASSWAQGGIVYQGQGDPQKLVEDIVTAGCKKNFLPAVELLAHEAPHAVDKWLRERLNIQFDVDGKNSFDLTLEAAHSTPRILHSKDTTGAAIVKQLDSELNSHPKIRRVYGTLVDLLMSNQHDTHRENRYREARVRGAYIFSKESSQVISIVSRAAILATGGFSQLYQHSTGPQSSRGDGISAAQRAGARTLDMEYVQFHPTALFIPGKSRKLLTEALRGAGAKLLNLEHKTFCDDLAPRDVVSRAIHEQLVNTGSQHVWLDMRRVQNLESKFPGVVNLLNEEGFDPSHDLIPVVPAAHYTLGGVWTNLEGATNITGLFASGEVACTGMHGANRLASTSLLEALVFGQKSSAAAIKYLHTSVLESFSPRKWNAENASVDPVLVQQDWSHLRQTLWNYVGLVRSENRLRRAEKTLVELRSEVESFYKKGELSDALIGLRHGVLVATLLLYSALRNRQSVGTHYIKTDA